MSYQLTPWGYEVDGDLPPLIDADEFDALTGGKWSSDPRVPYVIAAASAAIRNACGWHVAPSAQCRATLDGDGMRSMWLPTTCLTGVTEVTVNGQTPTGIQWSRIGQLQVDGAVPQGLQAATVDYTAGFAALPADVGLLVADLVARGIALSYGVSSETSGDVSVSYTGTAANAASASLTDADLARLSQYRVVRSHAV